VASLTKKKTAISTVEGDGEGAEHRGHGPDLLKVLRGVLPDDEHSPGANVINLFFLRHCLCRKRPVFVPVPCIIFVVKA